jgi:hypothetical protein
LPDCSSKEVAASRRPIAANELARLIHQRAFVHVRGRLGRARADCLLVGDAPDYCTYDWTVSPRAECPSWQLIIQGTDVSARLGRGGWDREVGKYARSKVEVIVAGRLAGEAYGVTLQGTEICRVPDEVVNREWDTSAGRLTDAEADRIASRPSIAPKRPCPHFIWKEPTR